MQETKELQIQSLSWNDPLEEELATHSSFPAWKIPGTEGPGGLQSINPWGDKESDMTEHEHAHTSKFTCTILLTMFYSKFLR